MNPARSPSASATSRTPYFVRTSSVSFGMYFEEKSSGRARRGALERSLAK